ncbi:hypothetical protein BDZ97DRAFT_1614825, partial [Flammula alnicola]
LPWAIKIYASCSTYITLEGVFQAIYRSLRTNVTRLEIDSISENEQRQATSVYEHRYRRRGCRRAYDEERHGGMKRVDFLMGRSRFLGISNS